MGRPELAGQAPPGKYPELDQWGCSEGLPWIWAVDRFRYFTPRLFLYPLGKYIYADCGARRAVENVVKNGA
jgi:hypothetical protein